MLIFDHSRPGRTAAAQLPAAGGSLDDLPANLRRKDAPTLPEVSELDAVRHYTRLSQKNFSIDTQFYPLGSCTMKYNPRVCHTLALLPQFIARHPSAPEDTGQGFLACLFELQEMLREVTGMAGVSLTPMAGAQGEFAGVAMIRAYHASRGDAARTEMLVPDAAHGTNPATAAMCGYTAKEIPTDAQGNVNLAALEAAVGPHTAGLMLTNPSTLGVFEKNIEAIERIVHGAGGLLYYDGANLNAILGKVKPGDMGFDVIHVNLHKTFSTPHGGGGGGAGHAARGGIRRAQCQLPDGGAQTGRVRGGLSGTAREPRIHRDAQGAQGKNRRLRHGFRQAPARQGVSCAHHLFSAARAGMPADRADRNGKPANPGRLRRGHEGDRRRSAARSRPGQGRALYHAGAAPGRCQGGARTGSRMESPFKGNTGLSRILRAARCSLAGLQAAWRNEAAFRQEVWLALVLLPAALLAPVGGTGRALLLASVLLVLIVELLNSAVEAAVDRISLESHELAKRAKDIGSAAVLLSLINLAAVWLVVLLA